MLEHLGYKEAGAAILAAIEAVLASGDKTVLTPDVGGNGSTATLGQAIAAQVAKG